MNGALLLLQCQYGLWLSAAISSANGGFVVNPNNLLKMETDNLTPGHNLRER